jgi:hypothetical protein
MFDVVEVLKCGIGNGMNLVEKKRLWALRNFRLGRYGD